MRPGEFAVICDGNGTDYLGRLESAEGECVFGILEKSPNQAEPSVHLRLFQAMPKGDKMDFIVQKAVECGACEVVPFISKRCVSRPDAKQLAKKTERWQRIAYEAAKQCGRGIIPQVGSTIDISKIPALISPENTGILFYECAETPLREAVGEFTRNIDIVIGSEGEGMGRLVAESCDFTVSIPMFGKINSLNASAAAAVLLYEAVRQRG